jgi:hypothetical protein
MRPTTSELRRSQLHIVAPRTFVEIVVAITASAVMAIMVACGGIATERWTAVQIETNDGPGHEPAQLSWREST